MPHLIAFLSRKLFPGEAGYSTVEKECMVVKWALDSFKYYLLELSGYPSVTPEEGA
jgi:hypothetical protein